MSNYNMQNPVETSLDATMASQYSDPMLRKLMGAAPVIQQPAPSVVTQQIDPKKVPIKLPTQGAPSQQSSVSPEEMALVASTQPPQTATSTSTSSIDEKSKAALKASGAREQAALGTQQDFLQAQSDANIKAQQEANEAFGSQAEKSAQLQQEVTEISEQAKKDLADIDAGIQKAKDFQFKDFWADKGTGYKIQSAISIGLGALGASLLGTSQNVGYELLKQAMADDARIQESKYQQILQGIENSKTSLATKSAMIDRANKNYEIYKVARFDAVKQSINDQLSKNPKFASSPELQAAMTQLDLEKEKSMQSIIDKTATRVATQSESKVANKDTLTPEQWMKVTKAGSETALGRYNDAVDKRNQVQSFKKSGLGKAAIVLLVSKTLEQGSYDPDKFDLRSQDQVRKWIDSATGKIKGVNDTEYFKSVEKLMDNQLAVTYNDAKGSIPAAMAAGQKYFKDQNALIRKLPKDFNPNKKDLSELGLKRTE